MASQQISETLASAFVSEAREDLNEFTTLVFSDAYLLSKLNKGTTYIVANSRCLDQVQEEQLVTNQLAYPIVKTGTHTGGIHPTILTVPASTFIADKLVGQTVTNTTDESSGVITANGTTSATVAALAGGSDNQWEASDGYSISYPYICVKTVVYAQAEGVEVGLLKGNIQSVGHNSQGGQPAFWEESGNDVRVYPKPNSTHQGANHDLDVYTVKRPAIIAATDNVLVPAIFDEALLLYMIAWALYKDKKYQSATLYMARCDAQINRYRSDFVILPKEPREIVK